MQLHAAEKDRFRCSDWPEEYIRMFVADLVLSGAAVFALSRFVSLDTLVHTDAVWTWQFAALVAALSLLYW